MEMERRPYGPESSQAERDAMLGRVTVLEDHIVRYRELRVQSAFTIELMMDRLEQVTSGWDRFGEVLDLRDCRRPDAASRAALKTRLGAMAHRIAHVGVIVEADAVMAVVARMVAFALGLPSISLHPTEEEALRAVRSALH